MKTLLNPIINQDELLALYSTAPFLIFDASNGPLAKANYESKHLDGAIFVDANIQLATIETNVAIGGRHPLPSIEKFSTILGELGITPQTRVVIYDDKNGANAAARFWWMLRSIGHENVQVLNGGIHGAEKSGLPINAKKVTIDKKEKYPYTSWLWPIASIEEIEKASTKTSEKIIDVRESFRYNGESEPLDLIAGHIPNAINIPFTENLDENGYFLSPETIREKYNSLLESTPTKNAIVHCGSGITACHTLLSLHHAGFDMPKLYVGSWSEWSRNHKPMITKD